MTYSEWEANRRYRIVRSHGDERGNETIIATGLTWDEAKAEAERHQNLYNKNNPTLTSWRKDLFLPELETPKWEANRG